jgi:hypothetical protein
MVAPPPMPPPPPARPEIAAVFVRSVTQVPLKSGAACAARRTDEAASAAAVPNVRLIMVTLPFD